jgi:hypothetical protein
MARARVEDMASIGFNIERSFFSSSEIWMQHGVHPQAEYRLPPNQFNINSKVGSEALEVSFITTGNLFRLAQCVEIGRQYLPSLWPNFFGKLINGAGHLDALNEVWWLKFWRNTKNVARGPKESANDPDFEWQIEIFDVCATCIINFEVKRRTSNINRLFKKGEPNASLKSISKKFFAVGDGVANVAALTLYHPVPSRIDREIRLWLEDQEFLHVLLVWTEGNYGAKPLKVFSKETHRWVDHLLLDILPEDLKVAGRTLGTRCEVNEAPSYIEKMIKGGGNSCLGT